ncbi:MAG: hypothetical protein BWY76_03131 [bacterium ADurb.Bin429]|nr:MAG: hypothetical protein BWY76_03131 [bacterium ADurb.Bin429]
MDGRDLPLYDARLFQSAALPRRGGHHSQPARRAEHLQHGRAAPAAAGRLLDLPRRSAVAGGGAAGDRRLLQQGPDSVRGMGFPTGQPLAVGRGIARSLHHRSICLPHGLSGFSRPAANSATRAPRFGDGHTADHPRRPRPHRRLRRNAGGPGRRAPVLQLPRSCAAGDGRARRLVGAGSAAATAFRRGGAGRHCPRVPSLPAPARGYRALAGATGS